MKWGDKWKKIVKRNGHSMIKLKLQKIQKCPHCGNDTLILYNWYVNPKNGKAMANFNCESPFCDSRYFKITDKIIKELILR